MRIIAVDLCTCARSWVLSCEVQRIIICRDGVRYSIKQAGFLGQRDNSRHCRYSFHSVCLDPWIRTMVAGPAWCGALDCGLFSHRRRPKGRHRYGAVGFLENLRATTERPVDKARPTQAHAARFAGTRALRTSSAVGVSANHFWSTSSARACASSLSA
jgi:hypothetical protein